MGAIKTAFDNIGNGIKHAFEAVGEIATGVLTLDFSGIAKGASHMVGAGGEMLRGAINLTPAAVAANTLFDGAIDKVLKQAGKVADSVVSDVLDTMAKDLDTVKNGVSGTLHGVMTGNLAEAGQGLVNTVIGGASVASDFTAGGLAMNAGTSAIGTVAKGIPAARG